MLFLLGYILYSLIGIITLITKTTNASKIDHQDLKSKDSNKELQSVNTKTFLKEKKSHKKTLIE